MIATIILAHANPRLVQDTIDAVQTWMTKNILVVVDKAFWSEFASVDLGVPMFCGCYHNNNRSPYRNYLYGLMKLVELYPEKRWYCYLEYDVLVANSGFLTDLRRLDNKGIWIAGNDLRTQKFDYPLLSEIIKQDIAESWYLLGCYHFLHHDFLKKLQPLLQILLDATNSFERGYFPQYSRYAFEEELIPTLAVTLGGKAYELACWKENERIWRGSTMYPCRFKPEMTVEEVPPSASLIHPVRNYNHPIRVHYRKVRQKLSQGH